MLDDDGPWSAGGAFGKTGQPSGIFNTYHIPFQASVTVTVELRTTPTTPASLASPASPAATPREAPHRPQKTTSFWIVLRGHRIPGTGFSLPGSGLTLPANAKLKTSETHAVVLTQGKELALFDSSAANGAVYMAAMDVRSQGDLFNRPTFLEGCFRAYGPNGDLRMLLSSGTEDYFLGTYYFNKGKYATPIAGLTNLNEKNKTTFSAYRVGGPPPPCSHSYRRPLLPCLLQRHCRGVIEPKCPQLVIHLALPELDVFLLTVPFPFLNASAGPHRRPADFRGGHEGDMAQQ